MQSFLSDLLAETPEGLRELVRAQLRVDVSEALLLRMQALQVSKAELAAKLGVSRSAVSQALSGTRNMSLNTLADMSAALELTAVVSLQPSSAPRPAAAVVPGWGPALATAANAMTSTYVVQPALHEDAPRAVPVYETSSSSSPGAARARQVQLV
jgi:transcriptional regulator with XRE-family HTH domain